MTTMILTAANLKTVLAPYGLPLDMQAEVSEALSSGQELAIEYHRLGGNNREPMHFIYFPNAGRGGVCGGGETDWTDCSGLDDLAHRWANYDERWAN